MFNEKELLGWLRRFVIIFIVSTPSTFLHSEVIVTTYTYDNNSNRISETVTVDNEQGKSLIYDYDSMNRLIGITNNLDASQNISYSYDNNGNRTSKTQATEANNYIYNAEDQLVRVEENSTTLARFAYDHQGMRIKKEGERGTEIYTYDDQSVLYQTDTNGALQAKYTYGPNQLLSITELNNQQQYYLLDGLGSPITLTKASGEVTARYSYDAFGNKIQNTGNSANRFTFTGHEEDRETDLIYMKARFYDPDTGQFLSEDNFGGFPDKPPSLNKYLYGYANPLYWRDPTGNYNEAGHFYTTYYVARTVGIGHSRAHKLAFYSQSPDEVDVKDAIRTQIDRQITKYFSLDRNLAQEKKNIRDRSHTKHHALTGKIGELATHESLSKISNIDPNDVRALGYEIHMLGDTFSHRRGNDEQALKDDARLFKKGMGHFWQGTAPDQIHKRPELYRKYVNTLARVLAEKEYGKDDPRVEAAISRADIRASEFIEAAKALSEENSGYRSRPNHKGRIKFSNDYKTHIQTPEKFRELIIQTDRELDKRLAKPEDKDVPYFEKRVGTVVEDEADLSATIKDKNDPLRKQYKKGKLTNEK